jgi:hypothetical protein
MDDLTEGQMVHFVLGPGECRAALIVRVLRGPEDLPGQVNMYVFLDGANDRPFVNSGTIYNAAPGIQWRTNVRHDPTATRLLTWHRMEHDE